jgi:restriction system protein
MLYPVEESIKNQDLLCVSSQETVRDAFTKMLEHDYSQLPIVNKEGELTGIISEQSVARSYYHLDEKVSVLDLKVNNCRENPVTVPIDQDVFDALDFLNQTYAVVFDGRKPVGIITNFDTTNFFRDVSEGMILVEDIEGIQNRSCPVSVLRLVVPS